VASPPGETVSSQTLYFRGSFLLFFLLPSAQIREWAELYPWKISWEVPGPSQAFLFDCWAQAATCHGEGDQDHPRALGNTSHGSHHHRHSGWTLIHPTQLVPGLKLPPEGPGMNAHQPGTRERHHPPCTLYPGSLTPPLSSSLAAQGAALLSTLHR
jgi:hypothetical protein